LLPFWLSGFFAPLPPLLFLAAIMIPFRYLLCLRVTLFRPAFPGSTAWHRL
jgi:hypothetical protein